MYVYMCVSVCLCVIVPCELPRDNCALFIHAACSVLSVR